MTEAIKVKNGSNMIRGSKLSRVSLAASFGISYRLSYVDFAYVNGLVKKVGDNQKNDRLQLH